MRFEIKFPLIHRFNNYRGITFGRANDPELIFENGIFYLKGHNGSGKSTFLSMLALLQGNIGRSSFNSGGKIKYGKYDYHSKSFNFIKASEIREREFCIFTQEIFFLPNLTLYENKKILTGIKNSALKNKNEYPDTLSGGWRQSSFISMILQEKMNVWFLDEPFNNLDRENTGRFWELLRQAYKKQPKVIFLIDHRLNNDAEKANSPFFKFYYDLHVSTQNLMAKNDKQIESRAIAIYKIIDHEGFIKKQIYG